MAKTYIVSHMHQQLGPFSEAELKDQWKRGEFLPIDYVYVEEKSDWMLFSEVFEWARPQETGLPPPIMDRTPVAPPPNKSEVVREETRSDFSETTQVPQTSIYLNTKKACPEVNLVGGVGQIDMGALPAGEIELVMNPNSDAKLSLTTPIRLNVCPADPHSVKWNLPQQITVGEDVEVLLHVVDVSGNVCTSFVGEFELKISGDELPETHMLSVQNGVARAKLRNQKTRTWDIVLINKNDKRLELPKEHTLKWLPGPAVQLVLDGPTQFIAGRPFQLAVRAVDRYGNLADNFQGRIQFDIKAS